MDIKNIKKYKKELKQLCSAYDKKLKECHKNSFSHVRNNIDYFVTYLNYIYDYYVLTGEQNIENEDLKMAALSAALTEYSQFKTCIFNYYKISNTEIVKISDEPEEEVRKKFSEERSFHWANFWKLVALNMESWSLNV